MTKFLSPLFFSSMNHSIITLGLRVQLNLPPSITDIHMAIKYHYTYIAV